jgi:hypothetical protein
MGKKLTLAVLGLLTFTFTGSAALVAYTQKVTRTETGGEHVVKSALTGWLLMDPDTAEIVFVSANARQKTFTIQTPSEYTIKTYWAGRRKDGTVIIIPGAEFGALVARGANANLNLSTNSPYRLPKTLAVNGSLVNTTNDTMITEYKGSLVLENKMTPSFNANHFSLAVAIDGLKFSLISQGYTQEEISGTSSGLSGGLSAILPSMPGLPPDPGEMFPQ